jgi:hypothetical protein
MHLQEDFLHDVFEISGATEHSLRQPRDVLAVRAKELSEGFGFAALAAFDQALSLHLPDFTSDCGAWLVIAWQEPCDRRRTGRWEAGTEVEGGGQPWFRCTAPVAFSDLRSEK